MRLILLEPNLIKPFGHVIEFPSSLSSAAKQLGWETILVSNNAITSDARAELLDLTVLPLITNSCFQDLEDAGKTFAADLERVEDKLQLNAKDLIVCITSYTNQILGTKLFLQRMKDKNIKMTLWLHQLFPPEKVFTDLLDTRIRNQWLSKLKRSLKQISAEKRIIIATTDSKSLQAKLKSYLGRSVPMLPLPYHQIVKSPATPIKNNLTVGFIGDGRYEKGGLIALTCIEDMLSSKRQGINFLVQLIGARGYSDVDLNKLTKKVNHLKTMSKQFEYIDQGLSTKDYYRVLQSVDILLFPYHPASYDQRVSGVLIQALLYGIPAIASKATWLGQTLLAHDLETVFNYSISSLSKSAENLRIKLEEVILNYDSFKYSFASKAKYFQNQNNGDKFLSSLLNSVNETVI